jgi:hypothetical protein
VRILDITVGVRSPAQCSRWCEMHVTPRHRTAMQHVTKEEWAMDRNQQRQGGGQSNYGADRSQSRASRQQGGQSHGGAQQSQQGAEQQPFGAQQFHSMAEVALRGTALLWDLQMETARNVWRTQARTAAMLGIPDCSALFHVGDDRARRLFTTSTEQMLNSARQARDTVVEMQRQMGRLAEQQTIGLTEEVRDQIEQISRHTEQGLQQIREIAASEADHVEGYVQSTLEENDARRQQHAEQRDESAPMDNESAANMADVQARGGTGATSVNGAQNPTWESDNTQTDAANEGRPNRETRRNEERSRARR